MLYDELRLGRGGGDMLVSEETLNSFVDGLHALGGVKSPMSTVKAKITFYKTLYYTVNPLGEWIRGKTFPWYEKLVRVMKLF
ncbi:hypothetical protein Taro_055145 [Colocasia esculenta]|uniref:Uncharacterized protein n=1 Tax=Colocasia esculenta TaxID=4460 RepID=A0A843XQ98_COLES|nr:hypothetical protein [Colocasia esculenta]